MQRRLLQVEERFGVQRIELTHDVLTEAIAKSRTERRQQEALAAAAEREAALRESLRHQRRRMLAGTLAAVAVFATISALAIYGWVQQREAVQQRDQAVRQKALALEAIEKLTYDLPERLEKVPGALTVVKDVYEDNVKLLDRALEFEGDSPKAMREKQANYNRIGQTWERLGDSAKAREAYDKARSIIERVAADDPANSQWQDDLAVSHVNIGDMLAAQGDQAKALEEYRAALNIRQRVAAQDPDHAEWQQKLASTHASVALQLMKQGDVAAARKQNQNALEIAQRLASKDPDNTDWQALLASKYSQLAQITLVQGDATGAIREGRAALQVWNVWPPRNQATRIGENRSPSVMALGNMLTMNGDAENAAKENGIAVAIYERLAAQDPEDAEWQKGLALSHFTSGNTLIDNDATRGISELRSALTLYERLVAKDPSNAELQNYITLSHMRIAHGLFTQKKFPEALTEARASLAAAQRMGAQDPKNIMMVQHPLAFAHLLIGGILKKQGDHGQAMKEMMASLEIFRRLAAQDPSNGMFQFQVANGGTVLADLLLAQKKYAEALQVGGNARDVLELLIIRFPDNRLYKSSLAENYGNIAWGLLLAQRPKEAIVAASKGLELDPTKNSRKINLAHAYLLTNQFEKAKAIYLENKDVKLPDGRGFAQVVLKDFKDLREAGVTHPDLNAIERLLSGEASAKRRN